MIPFLTIKPTDGRLAIIAKMAVYLPVVCLVYPFLCLAIGARELGHLGIPLVIEQFKQKGWRK